MNDIVIVGAGIAGLAAARKLTQAGREVLVVEKSRGFGGRAATRSVAGNRIDHGAQYFTVRDSRLQTQVDQWLEQGELALWAEGFHSLKDGQLTAPQDGHPRYAFPEGMNSFGKLLAEGLRVRRECQVTAISQASPGWTLHLEDSTQLSAAHIIVTSPAEQALALGQEVFNPAIQEQLRSVKMTPCFALMLIYPSENKPDWQGIFVEDDAVLSWIACDSSKRPNPKNTVLVAHARADFSQDQFDNPDKAATAMLEALTVLGAWTQKPLASNLQRWRYALASTALEQGFITAAPGLYLAGDWCHGNRVEGAYLSGLAVAEALGAQ